MKQGKSQAQWNELRFNTNKSPSPELCVCSRAIGNGTPRQALIIHLGGSQHLNVIKTRCTWKEEIILAVVRRATKRSLLVKGSIFFEVSPNFIPSSMSVLMNFVSLSWLFLPGIIPRQEWQPSSNIRNIIRVYLYLYQFIFHGNSFCRKNLISHTTKDSFNSLEKNSSSAQTLGNFQFMSSINFRNIKHRSRAALSIFVLSSPFYIGK